MERLKFTEKVEARVSQTEVEAIDALVLLHRDLWENRSHFIRSAIIRQLNHYGRENQK